MEFWHRALSTYGILSIGILAYGILTMLLLAYSTLAISVSRHIQIMITAFAIVQMTRPVGVWGAQEHVLTQCFEQLKVT